MGESDKSRAMAELGIDLETLNELLASFIPEAEEESARLAAAVAAGNVVEIAQRAHALKGMAGNLQLGRIAGAAKSIDVLAKEGGDMRVIREQAAELELAIRALKQDI